MSDPKYIINQRIRVNDTSSLYNGRVGRVIDPNWDYNYASGVYTVRVQLDAENGEIRSFYESSLSVEDPELAPVFVTRKQLKHWLDAMKAAQESSDNPFDNESEDAANEMDELLNPPAIRTYTVVMTGKINDIESAMENLFTTEEALSDKIIATITLAKEEKVQKDGGS